MSTPTDVPAIPEPPVLGKKQSVKKKWIVTEESNEIWKFDRNTAKRARDFLSITTAFLLTICI